MRTRDQERRLLLESLENVLGSDAAGILMDHLPPGGSGNLATKDDIAHAVTILESRIQREIHDTFNRQTWRFMTALFVSQSITATIIGLLI